MMIRERERLTWRLSLIVFGFGTLLSNTLVAVGRGLFLGALFMRGRAVRRALPGWLWCLFGLYSGWYLLTGILAGSKSALLVHDLSLMLLLPAGAVISAERRLSGMLRLLLWFGVLEALAVCWHAISGTNLAAVWEPGVRVWAELRPSGFLRSAPTSGQVLAIIIPLSVFFPARRPLERVFLIGAGLLMGIAIILTETRSAWVSASLLLLVAGFFRFGWKRVVPFFLLAGVLAWLLFPVGLRERMASITNARSDWVRCRTVLWLSGIKLGENNLLFGVGPGRFKEVYRQDSLPAVLESRAGKRLSSAERKDVSSQAHPHNDCIQAWAATGIPGLLLFLALVTAVAIAGVRNLRWAAVFGREKESIYQAGLLLFTGSVLVGIVDQSAFDPVRGNLFWLSAGLATGRSLIAY